MGDHQAGEKKKIDDPAKNFSAAAEEGLGHREKIGFFGAPRAGFQDEKAGAEHEKPADKVDEQGRDVAALPRRHRKGEHANPYGGSCNEEGSSDHVAKSVENVHNVRCYNSLK